MLEQINGLLWGGPLPVLLLAVGLLLTIRTGFVQLRLLPAALKLFVRQWKRPVEGEGTSPFRALCTALAATVGTGNIAGVAGAIAIGGPGAIFWMWVSGIIGMGTKFSEAALAVRYRHTEKGGPMYIMEKGLGSRWRPMAMVYCILALIAVLGVGNTTQISAFVTAAADAAPVFGLTLTGTHRLFLGLGLGALVWWMVSGGAGKIGAAAELLVPFASVVYLLLGAGVILSRLDRLGTVLEQIVTGAFSPRAVTGGAVGSAWTAVRIGVCRGLFTNEAGMGTAAMAHGGATGITPREQGLLGIVEVFVDTIVICSMTAFVILLSGVELHYGADAGAELTAAALSACYGGWVRVILCLCLGCFALATVMGWGLYAGRCLEYLRGGINWRRFALLQALGVVAGATVDSSRLWAFAEIANGLMALPNLLTLALLSRQAAKIGLDSREKM